MKRFKHVLITGAGGFVGRGLAQRLLAPGLLSADARFTLADLHLRDAPEDPRVRCLEGSIADADFVAGACADAPDCVFHLASIPGGTAERQSELAWQVNVEGTRHLLEQAAAGGTKPRFVFASSIAVFGDLSGSLADEAQAPRPLMSYGAHKLMGEILVADYCRRGAVDGCSLRLPGIVARPPENTGQLSLFMSDMIRKLAAGEAFTCPVGPDAASWFMSLSCCVDNLIHGATSALPENPWQRTWTLPVLHLRYRELAAAIGAVRGAPVGDLLRYAPDERIEALFGHQPPLHAPRALAQGFRPDADAEALVRDALRA
ncbi:MAG TPA: NAD-dependent epimerase/dehydratase family protein [Rhodocyclaceae bacterium]|nr:NAD-dependent epimerase/dehydratase family protein [Rhodocyclaceae bacterium]